MRIAIDARLYGIHHRGIGRYLVELVRALAASNTADEFILLVDPCASEQPLGLPGNFSTVPVSARAYTVGEQVAVASAIRRLKPDVTHIPHFSASVVLPKPFIITVHDLILHHFPSERATSLPTPIYYGKLAMYKLVVSVSVRRASKILVPSEAVGKDVTEYYPAASGKVALTYLAPGTGSPEGSNINFDFPYVLVVGAAYPHKNLERAIAAAAMAQRAVPNLRLVIVGRQDVFMGRLQDYGVKAGFAKAVVFFGEANESQLLTLYRNALCYIQPSLIEGFGLGPLEALQQGTPVIVSDIPVFHEILGQAAAFFDPLSVSEMSRAIIEHAAKKNLPAAAASVLQRYSWQNTAKATIEAYHNHAV